jgi:hypothetical protein
MTFSTANQSGGAWPGAACPTSVARLVLEWIQ